MTRAEIAKVIAIETSEIWKYRIVPDRVHFAPITAVVKRPLQALRLSELFLIKQRLVVYACETPLQLVVWV